MSTTSGQFLTVPPLRHRSSHHHRRHNARAAVQSSPQVPMHRDRPATRNVASSSRVKIEDAPLGIAVSGPQPASPSTSSRTTTTTSSSSSSASSPTPVVRRQTVTRLAPASSPSVLPVMGNSNGSGRSPSSSSLQPLPPPPSLSPRSIFRAMPFLLRLRSPPSDLLNMTCSSGGPRTHAVLNKPPININKAPQALIYNQTLVCEDAVNAEVLLRLARNELLERAQQTDRRVTALVDEEWRYTIRQTKNGDYNVQVFYSACPAQCESQNSNETFDPRKPVALSHVTNIPGLMRVVHSK